MPSNIIVPIVISVLVLAVILIVNYFNYNLPSSMTEFSVPLGGHLKVNVTVAEDLVLLTSGCLQISAQTSREQLLSIQAALEGVQLSRPNAHDIFMHTLNEFNIKVLAVKVESVREESYISKIIIQQGNKILNMDARPSDAIAIALRVNAPIYVKKSLFADYGKSIC